MIFQFPVGAYGLWRSAKLFTHPSVTVEDLDEVRILLFVVVVFVDDDGGESRSRWCGDGATRSTAALLGDRVGVRTARHVLPIEVTEHVFALRRAEPDTSWHVG